jgi:Zn-dependent peptidase ImmA (M78 family)
MPKINPKILTWARETAGLSLEAAADAIDLKTARGVTGADRLAALEAGQGEPTRPLLLRMAKKYRRSLLVFYLEHPPATGDRGQDFRKLPGAAAPEFNAQLDALIRDVQVRQGLIKSLLEDDQSERLPFIGSRTLADSSEVVARSIRDVTGFDLAVFRAAKDVDAAFTYLRARLESAGIFVLLIGNLGSHHTNIGSRTFRGFAIADPIAPFVVINDQDAHAAWSFTALHEAAHLWLGTSGISGNIAEIQIERFCNDVAGRLLLPAAELAVLADTSTIPFDAAVRKLSEFAAERNISRGMVAYQLLNMRVISSARWQAFDEHFYGDWQASRARKAEAKTPGQAGPSFPILRRHRLGPAMLNLVARSLSEGVLTYTKAGQLLGVKPRTVESILRPAAARGSA